jgi:hypothetical protein
MRRGANGEISLPERCENGNALVNVDEGTGDQRTRVILCSMGDADPAARLQRLQSLRERMASNSEIEGEHRARVLAALDRAIDQLRAQ